MRSGSTNSTANWSFRYGSGGVPRVANGLRFDRRILEDRGDVWEQEHRHTLGKHPGAIRLLEYVNHADAGTYVQTIQLAKQTGMVPDITPRAAPER